MTRFFFALLVFSAVAFPSTLFAQVGGETDLWDWSDKGDHHKSIVQVTAGEGTGTGVIIAIDKSKKIKNGFEGYCLTAWHVVQDNIQDNKIKIRYHNGRKAKKCRVLEHDSERDVAILWVWVPEDIKPAKLASKSIKGGDKLEFAGLGGGSDVGCCIRHFNGTASSPSTGERIFADVPLLPGDSGGPVFNSDQEVVGIISGGWFWYDGGVKTKSGSQIRTTWPARASNVKPIRSLMTKVAKEQSLTIQR